jgi:glycosyltransferase involved in cell wall biosynthesis
LVHHLFGTTAFEEASTPLGVLTWLQERPLRRVYGAVPVQAISHSTAQDLVERGLDRSSVTVIHPGVNLDFYRPASSPTRFRAPTFLYLGRLRRYKRIDLILRAFASVVRDDPSARLIIAGKGVAEGDLHRLAGEMSLGPNVDFTGFVSEEEKRGLFQRCWANIFVSPKEGWGITNLEAAACATPTIASDSPGLRESVVHGRTGILVPHGDVEALALAMLRFARDASLADRLGLGALDFARGFSWDRAACATEQHLLAAAGRLPLQDE